MLVLKVQMEIWTAVAVAAGITVVYGFSINWRRTHRQVRVSPQGVELTRGESELGRVDWNDLIEVRLLKQGGNVALTRRDGSQLVLETPEEGLMAALNDIAGRCPAGVEFAYGRHRGPLPPEPDCRGLQVEARWMRRGGWGVLIAAPVLLEVLGRGGAGFQVVAVAALVMAAVTLFLFRRSRDLDSLAEELLLQHAWRAGREGMEKTARPGFYEVADCGPMEIPEGVELVYPELSENEVGRILKQDMGWVLLAIVLLAAAVGALFLRAGWAAGWLGLCGFGLLLWSRWQGTSYSMEQQVRRLGRSARAQDRILRSGSELTVRRGDKVITVPYRKIGEKSGFQSNRLFGVVEVFGEPGRTVEVDTRYLVQERPNVIRASNAWERRLKGFEGG